VNDFGLGTIVLIGLAIVVGIFVLSTLFKSIRIIPQATAGVVERLGKYHKTLMPGLNILVPFIDRVRPLLDMREQVVSFPPQPVITEDNLVVSIDTVVFFQVTDARAATYEIGNYLGAVEQLTTTTLRNVVGGLNLEEALTSRDNINSQLRIVLDEATGKWGIRVGRVELKAIEPPLSIQDSMEKQMRAARFTLAILTQSCSRTNTFRCFLRSPTASRASCGSSRPSSPRRSRASPPGLPARSPRQRSAARPLPRRSSGSFA